MPTSCCPVRRRLAGLVLLIAFAAAGCGRRGDPVPPGQRLPGAPSKVSLSAPGGELILSWTAPREDLAGRSVKPLSGYAILRQAWDPGSAPCESCPEDLAPVGTLDLQERRARGLPENSWADPGARPGWTYRYRVRALDAQGNAGPPSGAATIRWVPLPVPAVDATPSDGLAALRVGATAPDDLRLEAVRVYRGAGARVAEAASGMPELVVSGLPNGQPSRLEVRAVARTREGWEVESRSAEVTVTPADTTPPLPPSDLVAFAEGRGIRLRWLPAGKEAYARVLVLRATETGRFEELADLSGDALSHLDTSAVSGTLYRYSVVALDAPGNRSIPTRETRLRAP